MFDWLRRGRKKQAAAKNDSETDPFRSGEYTGRFRVKPGPGGHQQIEYWARDSTSGQSFWTLAEPWDHPGRDYFRAFRDIELLKRAKNFAAAFDLAFDILPGLVAITNEDVALFGHRRIERSPPLEFVLECLVFLQDESIAAAHLASVEEMLRATTGLELWCVMADETRRRRKAWRLLLPILRGARDGIEQRQIAARLEIDSSQAAWLVRRALARGFLARRPSGKSYIVTLAPN